MKITKYVEIDRGLPVFRITGFDGIEICRFIYIKRPSLQKLAGIKHNRYLNKPISNLSIDWGVK